MYSVFVCVQLQCRESRSLRLDLHLKNRNADLAVEITITQSPRVLRVRRQQNIRQHLYDDGNRQRNISTDRREKSNSTENSPKQISRKNSPNMLVPLPFTRSLTCRYDKVAQSLPTLATKTPDQLRYALDQSLTFLKTQVLVRFLSNG
jgi:hypothetical protein